ncbi:GNAT family N-acetyltransferase [Streptomyces varsoviensis]|uniref:N-acetyltransferase domain-containing protein n=1 Tax=Streptomyces varsoviensis TaxID=67373 RepID=A0ABR5JCS3_9ACTN|nr:GNAT family N-acetyltransferase [Streptomyces varsoviensis]KOG90866.1 hypothetical protein ADK38_06310 [Streptomyces varsoviensis]
MVLELRRVGVGGLAEVGEVLVDLYVDIYAAEREGPFYSRERIAERLDMHAACDAWEAVIGYGEAGEPAGYVYGARLPEGSGWWEGMVPAPGPEFVAESGSRTLAVFELMVRKPWRGTGLARRLHDELLVGRAEERATLLVDPGHPKVRELYEGWGYEVAGRKRPSLPGAPVYAVMVRALGR